MMREGLKLACVRSPKLSKKLDDLKTEHPNLGDNLEHVNIIQLSAASREFLQMKLDDDRIRRSVGGTVLSMSASPKLKLFDTLLIGLKAGMPVDDAAPFDAAFLEARINEAVLSSAEIRAMVAEFGTTKSVLEVAKAVHAWILETRGKLLDSVTPPAPAAEPVKEQ